MVRSCLRSSELLSEAQENRTSAKPLGLFSLGEEPGPSWDAGNAIQMSLGRLAFLCLSDCLHRVVETLGIAANLYGYPEVWSWGKESHFCEKTVDAYYRMPMVTSLSKAHVFEKQSFQCAHTANRSLCLFHRNPFLSNTHNPAGKPACMGETPGRWHCRSGQCPPPEDR